MSRTTFVSPGQQITVNSPVSQTAYSSPGVQLTASTGVLGAAQMNGATSVAVIGRVVVAATAQMDGQAQVEALSVNTSSGAARMDGQTQVSVVGIVTSRGAARMDGHAQVSGTSGNTTTGAARMDGRASQVVLQSVHGAGLAEMPGEASMAAVAPSIYRENLFDTVISQAETLSLYEVIVGDTINLTDAPACRMNLTALLRETTIVVTSSPQPHSHFHYELMTLINMRPNLTPAWSAVLSLVQNLLMDQTINDRFIWGRQLTQALEVSAALAASGRYQKLLAQLFKLSEVEGFKLRHPVALSQNVNVSLSLASGIGLKLLQKFQIATATSLKLDYHLTLASKVVLGGTLDYLANALLEQLFTVHPAIDRQLIATSLMAQLLTVHPVLGSKLIFKVVGYDNLQLSPDQLVNMIYAGDPLLDGVVITALYISPSGTTTTWAVNTRTAAVTEYLNYDFRSFAPMGNKYIAAGPGGLYELDGDTDDGALIISRLMSGYLQLNEKKLFGIKGAYVAIRGGGRFYLKLIAGDGREYVYELKAQPNLMTTKVKVGKGIKTTYMAFELVTEGQDFDLDSVEFIPMTSGRRV